ncbi:MAG TPA: type II toxin-antitoxin system VapC family toxin [Xanthobacteraceae bacterium]|nr:type II toxin-antitoxin system VapC family toxin [Xanthobacteraceae bacterium]
MILLDTNVVSAPWRPRPDDAAIAWLEAQPFNSLYLCTPVLAELRFGAERLDPGGRRDRLRTFIDRLENEVYRGRILALDAAAAAEYGRVAAMRERAGRRIELMDAMVAAIAIVHRAVVATRDVSDFTGLGLDIINPFEFNG